MTPDSGKQFEASQFPMGIGIVGEIVILASYLEKGIVF
jgi:hypothetical protein